MTNGRTIISSSVNDGVGKVERQCTYFITFYFNHKVVVAMLQKANYDANHFPSFSLVVGVVFC